MPGRDEGGGTLLERDRELERIAQGLRRSRGGQGSALVVEGPAGIGKSAILVASRDTAVSEGFRVLRARGSELEREYAFGVVRQLFEPMLAEAPGNDRDSLLQGAPGLAARLLGFPGHDGRCRGARPILR